LYSWGHGLSGQLSLGNKENSKVPTQVRSLGMLHACQVACSFRSSYVVCEPSIRLPTVKNGFEDKTRPQIPVREKKGEEPPALEEDEETKKVQEKYERMKVRNMELRKEIEELRRKNTHLTATDLTELPPEELDDLRKTFLHGIQKVGETRGSKLRGEMKEREKILLEELEKVYLSVLKEYHKKETEIRHEIHTVENDIAEIEVKLSGFKDQWNMVSKAEAWIPGGREEIHILRKRWEKCTEEYEQMAKDHQKATKKANDAIRERKRLETRYEMLSDEMSQLEDEIEHLSLQTKGSEKDKDHTEKQLPLLSGPQIRQMTTKELRELEDKYQTALTHLIQ
jgi:phage shock protein A